MCKCGRLLLDFLMIMSHLEPYYMVLKDSAINELNEIMFPLVFHNAQRFSIKFFLHFLKEFY